MGEDNTTPLTRQNAETAREFRDQFGKTWRRNGKTQTWKTRPEDFRIPIKHGLRSYDALTPENAHLVEVIR